MYRVTPIKWILLTIVTCGIYGIYAWYKLGENMNTMAAKAGEAPIKNYIVAMLLGMITCGIYPLIWLYKYFSLADTLNAKANTGITPTGPIMMIIMSIIPIYSYFWLASMNDKLCDAYEN